MSQEKSFRNRRALYDLRAAGFSLPRIRRGLLAMSGVEKGVLARRLGVSPATVSNTIRGHRHHPKVMQALAEALGLERVDLWPESNGPAVKRRPVPRWRMEERL